MYIFRFADVGNEICILDTIKYKLNLLVESCQFVTSVVPFGVVFNDSAMKWLNLTYYNLANNGKLLGFV